MKKGLTVVELLISIGVLAILLLLGTVIYSNFAQKDQVLTVGREIENIINEAKAKTMAGFTLGGSEALNFGVYFETDRYVLFPGTSFNPGHIDNQEFTLPTTVSFTNINLPSNSLVFEKVTGEVINYDPVQSSIVLESQRTLEEKIISFNQLGVVTIE